MATVQPNFRSPEASMREAQRVWHRLFEHSPVPILLLTPDLKIVDANASYLSAVSRARQALAGLAVFDAFPDNPHVPGANGVSNLAASFEKSCTKAAGTRCHCSDMTSNLTGGLGRCAIGIRKTGPSSMTEDQSSRWSIM